MKQLRFMGYNFSHPKNITIQDAVRDSGSKSVEELQEKASNGPLHLHYGHSGGMAYQVVYNDYPEGREEGELLIDETANKKPIPKHVREYKTFEELPLKLQNKIIRKDKLFCQKNGFPQDKEQIKNNLYHADGSLACMTIQERKEWYAAESKTETVYKYRLSSEWSNAIVWGGNLKQALSRRGKLHKKNYTLNGVKMQGKTIIINKIIEVKKINTTYTAIVELEDGKITEVSAVVEDSLILR